MRRLLVPLVVFLAAALPLLGADPKIDGHVNAEPYKIVRLTVRDMDKDASAIWKVRPLDPANEGKVSVTAAGLSGDNIEWVGPPGRYRVELTVGAIKDGKFRLVGDELVVTVGTPPDSPKPNPPKPDPKPPVDPEADAALAAKFAGVLKTADEKKQAAALGGVYSTNGLLLPQVKDPAVRPKTVQAMIDRLTEASVAADVPRLPALLELRKLIDADIGRYEASAPMTDALADELGNKYQRVGAALKAAAK